MVHPPSLAALQELRTLPPLDRQLHLLRSIKNDIVGHGQRKHLAVRHGLLDCLNHILPSSSDDQLQLQLILILGSLAEQGPAFVAPILHSNLIQPLLHSLPPTQSSTRIVTASLRALNALAASWSLSLEPDPLFVQHIFNPSSIASFLHILRQPLPTTHQKLHIALTSNLIASCCAVNSSLRPVLVKAGLLDALASLLAKFALAYDRNTLSSNTHLDVTALIHALCFIVRDSTYRAHRLLFSQDLRRIFAYFSIVPPSDNSHFPDFEQPRSSSSQVHVEHLLPKVVAPSQKPLAFGHPAGFASAYAEPTTVQPPASSPLCVWLMFLARSQHDSQCRLAALRLLAVLNDALDADSASQYSEGATKSKERERQMALFAIPIAVKLVQDALDKPPHQDATVVTEDACSVLAHLVENNSELQKAALDAGAVKFVSQLFKRSFDPVTLARPMWSANPQALEPRIPLTPSTTLGDDGLAPEIMLSMKCRAGALDALAAIAEKEDANRKAVIESAIVPNLIDSLVPLSVFDTTAVPSKAGNTVQVLLAACRAATTLSRSVSLLRTSLIDAGIAKPIFALLKHEDLAVQIAATNVTCNLVLDFSPMRQDLIDAGVVKTLCEHAKRSDLKLRQSSLWALKHLVLNAPQSTKHTCLEELGTGWLIQVVNGNSQPGASAALGRSINAAGEQVDLLNAPETAGMDMDWIEQDNDDDDEDGEVMLDQNGTRYQSSEIRSTLDNTNHREHLRALRENEQNPSVQAKNDDMLVQEQALDFIRNLVNGDENVAMIDYLLDLLGADQLFEILYNKLKPISNLTSSPQTVWQPPELINAALGIIVHLAGGSSKHRQQLIAQKSLLTAWLPHFSHSDRRIRVASVWAVINLTWRHSASDDSARGIAQELRSVGIDDKVRALVEDIDLDTKERVRQCVRQLDELLEGGRYR